MKCKPPLWGKIWPFTVVHVREYCHCSIILCNRLSSLSCYSFFFLHLFFFFLSFLNFLFVAGRNFGFHIMSCWVPDVIDMIVLQQNRMFHVFLLSFGALPSQMILTLCLHLNIRCACKISFSFLWSTWCSEFVGKTGVSEKLV